MSVLAGLFISEEEINILAELRKKYPSLKIIKRFPESGQKKVYLVSINTYGVVVLKIIKKMDERVQREIDIVNDNNIPGVPKIKAISSFPFEGQEYFYLIEEYVEGITLAERMQAGALPLQECLELLKYLLTVVAQLETLAVVHRDIKPDNIICAKDGTYHLIDFGIARNLKLSSLTLTAAAVGPHTPGYGAPELFQYNKSKIDSRADLFSVGVVAYQAIFGKHPFITGKEADLNEIWYLTATVTPQEHLIPGDQDGQLMGLIQTLMQKQVSKRPPSGHKALEWYYTVLDTLSI